MFPKNRYLQRDWKTAISKKKFSPKRAFVCPDHFPNGDGRTFKHNVPTLFLPQNEGQKLFVSGAAGKAIMTLIRYAKSPLDEKTESVMEGASEDQKTQTDVGALTDTGTSCYKPEITIEDIRHSEDVQFYNGLPNYPTCPTFMAVIGSFVEHGAGRIAVESDTPKSTKYVKRKLRLIG